MTAPEARLGVGAGSGWGGPESDLAQVLRQAVAASGLTLGQIVERLEHAGLSVTRATLSAWQTGTSRPRRRSSGAVLAELERVLHLAPGALTRSGATAAGAGRTGSELPGTTLSLGLPPEVGSIAPELEAVRAAWGVPWDDSLGREMVLSRAAVGRQRRSELQRVGLRCLRGGTDRLLVGIYRTSVGELPDLLALSGCAVGRSAVLGDGAARAVELLLPRPLEYGQGWTVQFATSEHAAERVAGAVPAADTVDQGAGLAEHGVRPSRPVGLLVAQVVFDDDARPAEVRRVRSWTEAGSGEIRSSAAWAPLQGRSASCVVPDGRAARCAIQWRPS